MERSAIRGTRSLFFPNFAALHPNYDPTQNAISPRVIPGCAAGAGPESIFSRVRKVIVDSGLALRAPRNDGVGFPP